MSTTTPPAGGRDITRTHDRWTTPGGGCWVLEMHWQLIDRRPECVGLKLYSTPLDGQEAVGGLPDVGVPLTAGDIRGLSIGERIRDTRAALAGHVGRPPVRQSTEARLREATRVYLDAFARGEPPTSAVAAHFGITPGGASTLVWRARDAGMLPLTSRGTPMGAPRGVNACPAHRSGR